MGLRVLEIGFDRSVDTEPHTNYSGLIILKKTTASISLGSVVEFSYGTLGSHGVLKKFKFNVKRSL